MASNPREQPGITGGQFAFVLLMLAVLVGSLVAVPLMKGSQTTGTAGGDVTATGLAAQPGEGAPEPGMIERALPKVTEASFFGLIGFALGYATRKLVKVILIGIALVFLAIQGLAWAGWLQIDWGSLPPALEGLLSGVREGDAFTSLLLNKIPAGAALVAGLFVGFKRG